MRRYLQLSQRSTYIALYCRSILYYRDSRVKLTRYALLVFVRSCSSTNNKIISLKKSLTTASWGPSKRKKNPGALGTCPVWPLVKTALMQIFDGSASRPPTARSAGPAALQILYCIVLYGLSVECWFATAYSSQQRMRTHARTDRQVENVMPAASRRPIGWSSAKA